MAYTHVSTLAPAHGSCPSPALLARVRPRHALLWEEHGQLDERAMWWVARSGCRASIPFFSSSTKRPCGGLLLASCHSATAGQGPEEDAHVRVMADLPPCSPDLMEMRRLLSPCSVALMYDPAIGPSRSRRHLRICTRIQD